MQDDSNPFVYPKKADLARVSKYKKSDLLYFGDHYDAFNIAGQTGSGKDAFKFPTAYQRLRYVAVNFAGLCSRVMADMLFGENIAIDFTDKTNQKWVEALLTENQLFAQLYESALGNSRRGDAVFKIRVGQRNPSIVASKSTIIIEEINPEYYFPVFDNQSTRNTTKEDVIAYTFSQPSASGGKQIVYLHKEIHTPGKIRNEVWTYNDKEHKLIAQVDVTQFGYVEEEETGLSRSLVFHIPNVRDSSGFYGTSDYRDLESLFFAVNNRITKTDNILDKHSDPILAVPPGVLNEDGQVDKSALGMFEVDNENPGFNKPEYIVWNANLDNAFKQLEVLIQLLYTIAEISPDSTGANQSKGGVAESGRALRFRLLATIRKRNRKIRYYDQALKDILQTAIELGKINSISIADTLPGNIERPTIKWGDGIINDQVEQTEIAVKRVDAGIQSREDAIVELDGVTQEEARKKVAEIDKEQDPKLEPVQNNIDGNGVGIGSNPKDKNQGA